MNKKLSSVELIYHASSYTHLGHITNYEATDICPVFTYHHASYCEQMQATFNSTLPITELIHRRKTTRSFNNVAISHEQLLGILFNAYALKTSNTFTIPQAGNLAIMRLIILEKQTNVWQIYTYDPSEYRLNAGGQTEIDRLFFTKSIDFKTASHCIIITSLLNLFSKIYLTRAYKFACLQAGHIAQNITLTATAANIATVTLGSLIEDEIMKRCCLGSDEFPLYAVILGK